MPPKRKKPENSRRSNSVDYRFAKTILDSITAHVAILDKNGFILETNRAWQEFARQNRIQMRPDTLHVNYLEICDHSSVETDGNSSMVASGIRDVISGKSEEFIMDYPCHSPEEKRWFYMRVTRATGPGPIRVVVSHENITALKLAEERLREGEEALWLEKQKLKEANTALKVLLRKRESDQREMESTVLDSIRHLVTPVLQRLSSQTLPERSKNLLNSLENRLAEITEPLYKRLSAIESILTPQEIEVATLIREGRSSKEIAKQLYLSITTVNFHRRNLRKKLKLRNTGTNLRSFLIGLTD